MLEKGRNKVLPCGRNGVGALDSPLSSIPFGVCAFFSAAAANFVDDSNENFQKKGFPESWFPRIMVLQIFVDPTRCPKA